jgi:hypothetical protein
MPICRASIVSGGITDGLDSQALQEFLNKGPEDSSNVVLSAQISRTPLYSDYLINGTQAKKYRKEGQAIQILNMSFRKEDHHCKLRNIYRHTWAVNWEKTGRW